MLVVENALKNDPAKYAAVQKFEAGPIYKKSPPSGTWEPPSNRR